MTIQSYRHMLSDQSLQQNSSTFEVSPNRNPPPKRLSMAGVRQHSDSPVKQPNIMKRREGNPSLIAN